jgi:hypothetical protein
MLERAWPSPLTASFFVVESVSESMPSVSESGSCLKEVGEKTGDGGRGRVVRGGDGVPSSYRPVD